MAALKKGKKILRFDGGNFREGNWKMVQRVNLVGGSVCAWVSKMMAVNDVKKRNEVWLWCLWWGTDTGVGVIVIIVLLLVVVVMVVHEANSTALTFTFFLLRVIVLFMVVMMLKKNYYSLGG